MKLTHHSEAVKQDDARVRPDGFSRGFCHRNGMSQKAHPKHNPFSLFKPAVSSLALLSAFTFSPMIFPRPAAAQEMSTSDSARVKAEEAKLDSVLVAIPDSAEAAQAAAWEAKQDWLELYSMSRVWIYLNSEQDVKLVSAEKKAAEEAKLDPVKLYSIYMLGLQDYLDSTQETKLRSVLEMERAARDSALIAEYERAAAPYPAGSMARDSVWAAILHAAEASYISWQYKATLELPQAWARVDRWTEAHDAQMQRAARDSMWDAQPKDRSILHFALGFGYNLSILKQINNIPLAIRNVPVNPGDIPTYGPTSSWALPIGETSVNPAGNLPLLDITFGPTIPLDRGVFVIGFGAGGEFSFYGGGQNERNYVENGAPTSGDSASYVEGSGTALTYYEIAPGPIAIGGLLAIEPYIFAEVKMRPSDICGKPDGWGVSIGHRIYYETGIAQNGWDRYAEYTVQSSFNLIDMVTGMPYAALNFYDSDYGKPCVSIYAGLKYMIGKQVQPAADGAQFVFRNPAPAFGVFVNPASLWKWMWGD